MFLIGKINPAKLLNFPEIDVFVLVACPENSLLDSKVLFKPVVSETETAGQMGGCCVDVVAPTRPNREKNIVCNL
jgi:diphthamide synthase subunit DPH2